MYISLVIYVIYGGHVAIMTTLANSLSVCAKTLTIFTESAFLYIAFNNVV